MFTGIVEEQGVISNIATGKNSATLFIKCKKVLEGTNVGDSIAVNGVCLTVTTIGKGEYTADIMHETLNRSSLGQLKKGDYVNLERAMAADGRFGGHIVSGHIDGTGSISDIYEDDNAVWYTIKASKDILRYIVEKGSVTIDGISLTVAYVDEQSFKVSTIPHTRKETNLSEKKAGSTVNLECDIIGKYVEKLMGFSDNDYSEGKKSNITEKLLAENGFI
ncbi:MAG: riboflavin synthase [Lachnospiraceae bacterium]|nr:riboflavin synthase [Lachnospiraceae bacterium]MDE6251245.1 riboflavin synthase [Lachnospiraceae bacterium]